VIAPNTNGKDAVFLAERIRQSIEQNQPKSIVLQKPMTTSIGVACTVNGNFTAKELISIADEALYAVKRHKRNGVKLGTPNILQLTAFTYILTQTLRNIA
jgi:diguanylate cyclase (GGDEF)-like protein